MQCFWLVCKICKSPHSSIYSLVIGISGQKILPTYIPSILLVEFCSNGASLRAIAFAVLLVELVEIVSEFSLTISSNPLFINCLGYRVGVLRIH